MRKIDLHRRWLTAILLAGAARRSLASGASTIEVWVDLSERPPAPAATASSAAGQRERVARQQDRVAEALARLGAVELARVGKTGNAIAVRIDRARLDEVRAIPGVKRIRPARTLHPPQTGGSPRA
jgi:hypothetical protein